MLKLRSHDLVSLHLPFLTFLEAPLEFRLKRLETLVWLMSPQFTYTLKNNLLIFAFKIFPYLSAILDTLAIIIPIAVTL